MGGGGGGSEKKGKGGEGGERDGGGCERSLLLIFSSRYGTCMVYFSLTTLTCGGSLLTMVLRATHSERTSLSADMLR